MQKKREEELWERIQTKYTIWRTGAGERNLTISRAGREQRQEVKKIATHTRKQLSKYIRKSLKDGQKGTHTDRQEATKGMRKRKMLRNTRN